MAKALKKDPDVFDSDFKHQRGEVDDDARLDRAIERLPDDEFYALYQSYSALATNDELGQFIGEVDETIVRAERVISILKQTKTYAKRCKNIKEPMYERRAAE